MKKVWIIIILIYIATILLLIFLPNRLSVSDDVIINSSEIDSIYIINDSISVEIDTIYIQIKETKIEYEKDYNTIITNNMCEDYIFFSDYLKSRFDSTNHI